jgi:hypothetical protein
MEKLKSIEKIRIPDEDMSGWMQTLREGGFNDQELDSIFVYLNKAYRGLRGGGCN